MEANSKELLLTNMSAGDPSGEELLTQNQAEVPEGEEVGGAGGEIPWAALCICIVVAWLLIAVVVAVGLTTGAGAAAGWGMAPLSMLFVLIVTCTGCGLNGRNVAELPPSQTPRIPWLDNAKTFLICCVVLGHTGMAFAVQGAGITFSSGRNTWFMPAAFAGLVLLKPLVVPLFFFISGFFAASGLDKKGPQGFMRANLTRLGPAYFLFWLFLNPLLYYMAYALVRPTDGSYSYFPNSAHTWFLNWLLVFQCCYALVGGPKVRMEVPSFARFFCWSIGLAIMQLAACVALAVGGSSLGFAEGPMMSGGDGFWCGATFAAGIVAQRNDWLVNRLPQRLVVLSRIYVTVMVLVVILVSVTVISPLALLGTEESTFLIVALLLQIPSGPYLPYLLVTVVDLFQKHGGCDTSVTRFMAQGAFAVYLLHYFVVNIYTYTWAEVLKGPLDTPIVFVNSTATESEVGGGYICLGFVYVSTLSIITSFAIAGFLKVIPGVKHLL
ncbi:unnamed protein product [Prorocentrum cordatum]|uniref:Acyltransferase 3 domain-containing protein n=1 Tax=Prorocentrum cordatum TaxID=2364126 RepID=A0ABN9T5V4_9DINO|nr:unnamed protein product [Polarella glacialis]